MKLRAAARHFEDACERFAPLLLAVAVGATSGLLGAWWPRSGPAAVVVAAAPVANPAQPTALIESEVPLALPFVPRRAARIELTLFCKKVPAQGEVSYR